MYCKHCATEVEDQTLSGAYCPNCVEWLGSDELSETKPTLNKYIVKVPFSGQSRGYKVFHVDATSEDTAVHKVKNYNGGDLISEKTDRDDRSEDRQDAECYGLVNSEPEDANWWKNKSNFPCMLIAKTTSGHALVWVHYQIDGIAYDVRDNGYRLIEHTNWRRATKEEILNNIKKDYND